MSEYSQRKEFDNQQWQQAYADTTPKEAHQTSRIAELEGLCDGVIRSFTQGSASRNVEDPLGLPRRIAAALASADARPEEKST